MYELVISDRIQIAKFLMYKKVRSIHLSHNTDHEVHGSPLHEEFFFRLQS